jgi:hypothetical protein
MWAMWPTSLSTLLWWLLPQEETTLPAVAQNKYLRVVHGRADTREHVWLDHLLSDQIDDLSRREALARASNQETLSLALTAQAAIVQRLRDSARGRYWSLLNGTAVQVE